jgi:calcineurin-like phosphoesterase family protein
MNEVMVARWNETVAPKDEIWHLGNFAIRQSAAVVASLLSWLNGTKHLLIGNNDPPATAEQPAWTSVEAYAEMAVDGVFVVLCHYTFRSWRDMAKGSINLHGHCHGRLKPQPRQFDVGIDVWNFWPVIIRQILMRNPRARRPA